MGKFVTIHKITQKGVKRKKGPACLVSTEYANFESVRLVEKQAELNENEVSI